MPRIILALASRQVPAAAPGRFLVALAVFSEMRDELILQEADTLLVTVVKLQQACAMLTLAHHLSRFYRDLSVVDPASTAAWLFTPGRKLQPCKTSGLQAGLFCDGMRMPSSTVVRCEFCSLNSLAVTAHTTCKHRVDERVLPLVSKHSGNKEHFIS